jgi:hypothetical protein
LPLAQYPRFPFERSAPQLRGQSEHVAAGGRDSIVSVISAGPTA